MYHTSFLQAKTERRYWLLQSLHGPAEYLARLLIDEQLSDNQLFE